jgi:hypothetical protein
MLGMPCGMLNPCERASACKRERGLQGRAPPERPGGVHVRPPRIRMRFSLSTRSRIASATSVDSSAEPP